MHSRRITDSQRIDFLEVHGLAIRQHPYDAHVEVQSDWHDGAGPAVGKTVREAIDVAMNDVERAMAKGELSRDG